MKQGRSEKREREIPLAVPALIHLPNIKLNSLITKNLSLMVKHVPPYSCALFDSPCPPLSLSTLERGKCS